MQRLDYNTAASLGFPVQPRRGQRVRDQRGVVWQWFDEPGGLGDLGFWGAIIGAATGLVSLFAGNKSKKQAQQYEQALQEQQKQIDLLNQQLAEAQQPRFGKQELFLVGLALMGFMFLTK